MASPIAAPKICELLQLGQQLSNLQSQTVRKIIDEPIVDAKGLHVPKRPKKFVPLGPVRSTASCSSYDRLRTSCTRVRCSSAKNIWPSESENLCHGRYSRCQQRT